jgi:hypothetical protein
VVGWLVRLIFIPSGIIAGWLVAKDAPNFSAVQLTVGLLLIFFIILVMIVAARLEDLRNKSSTD